MDDPHDRSPGEGDVGVVLLAAHDRGNLSMAEVQDNLTALLLTGPRLGVRDANVRVVRAASPRFGLRVASRRITGRGRQRTLKWRGLHALQRTRNTVRETLRLYPPAWAVNRQATESAILGGYEIPPRTQVMLPQRALHRDGRFWEAPERFDPSQWERGVDRPEYAHFPFSGGPRHCIGMRFARLELVMALATMAGRVALDVTWRSP